VESIALTAGEIAAVTGGRVIAGDADRRFERVSIDSRTVAPGDLFVAILGDRFDGHDFVKAALSAGAAGAVVSEPQSAGNAPVAIAVGDTTRALQDLSREVRRRSAAKVVAITGSAGKTTT